MHVTSPINTLPHFNEKTENTDWTIYVKLWKGEAYSNDEVEWLKLKLVSQKTEGLNVGAASRDSSYQTLTTVSISFLTKDVEIKTNQEKALPSCKAAYTWSAVNRRCVGWPFFKMQYHLPPGFYTLPLCSKVQPNSTLTLLWVNFQTHNQWKKLCISWVEATEQSTWGL